MNIISSKILSSNNNSTEVDLFGSSKYLFNKTDSNASIGDNIQHRYKT